MKYYVIGDEDTVLGLGMVGVDGRVVHEAGEAAAVFDEVLADKTIGIIIITENAADLIRSRVDGLLFSESFPLVVEIPDRSGHKAGRPGLRETVNSAIGIQLG